MEAGWGDSVKPQLATGSDQAKRLSTVKHIDAIWSTFIETAELQVTTQRRAIQNALTTFMSEVCKNVTDTMGSKCVPDVLK